MRERKRIGFSGLAVFLAAVLAMVGIAAPVRAESAEGGEAGLPGTRYEGSFAYRVREDGSAELTGYTGSEEKVKIPLSLDGHEVVSIAAGAFNNGGAIKEIELPDELKELGENPFAACAGLEKFVISPYHEYFAVIDGVLFEKGSRSLAAFPAAKPGKSYEVPQGILAISPRAFAACSLEEITLPGTVEKIGSLAFCDSEKLKSFTIPDSVKELGANPFAGCGSLAEITLGEGRTDLAFTGGMLVETASGKVIACIKTPDKDRKGVSKTIAFPEGVVSIGDYAFAKTKGFTKLELPETVTSIGAYAFYLCALSEAVLPPTLQEIGAYAFTPSPELTVTVSSQFEKKFCDRYGLAYVYADEPDLSWLTGSVSAPAPGSGSNGHIVCIDAGHQQHGISEMEPNGPGSDVLKAKLTTGAQGTVTGLTEYQLNLDVSLKLRDELQARGYRVVMIRENNDCPMSNAERAQFANSSGAEVFIRVHANSSDNPDVRGALFYAPSPANIYMSQELVAASNAFASTVLNMFCAATGLRNLSVLQDDTMTGINWCRIPVAIAEMGFMSNPDEDRLMADPEFQKVMAKGLADGIDAYFGINQH